jgi:hypothetical protein
MQQHGAPPPPGYDPRYAAMMPQRGQCQNCGRVAPVKHVTFMQNIGLLILRLPRTVKGYLCKRCISEYFWKMTTITFFLGWWGVISFFYTLVSIPLNIVNYLGALSLPDE